MIATQQEQIPDYSRKMNHMFDVDWETLSQISRTSRHSDRESFDGGKCAGHEKLNLSNDWAMALGNDRLDLIHNASSLTDDSCYSLQSSFDDLDNEILSTVPFEEDEYLDTRDTSDTSEQKCEDSDNVESQGISYDDKARIDTKLRCANNGHDFIGGGSISYAQLFFDPQTKALVTLMEISNSIQPTRSRHTNNRNQNARTMQQEKKCERESETPLHCSSELLPNSDSNSSFRKSTVQRDSNSTKRWNHNQDKDDSPFQDETLSTECSSLSSETFRGHDLTRSGEDEKDNWAFADTHLHPHSPTRFTEEPIVFSNDRSMNQELCWLDKADIGLYLLEDCADPWDYGGSSGGGRPRCGQSIKKLLTASTRCISLPQLGESKWGASTSYYQRSDLSHQNHKAKMERMSYSMLDEL